MVYNHIRAGIRTFKPREVRVMEKEEKFNRKVREAHNRGWKYWSSTLQSFARIDLVWGGGGPYKDPFFLYLHTFEGMDGDVYLLAIYDRLMTGWLPLVDYCILIFHYVLSGPGTDVQSPQSYLPG